jgi:hypothetical protein
MENLPDYYLLMMHQNCAKGEFGIREVLFFGRLIVRIIWELISREDPLFDRLAIDEMLLHKPRDSVRGHAHVPRSLGIHDQYRPSRANSQALDLCPVTSCWTSGKRKIALFQFRFELVPRRLANFARTTRIAYAEKNVSMELPDQHFPSNVGQLLLHLVHEPLWYNVVRLDCHRRCS